MISFFDANCIVGRRSAPLPDALRDPDDILDEMDRVGIDGALATHASAIETDILGGNAEMSEIAARQGRFQPCYVIVPHHTGEMPRGDALVRYLETGRARTARMYPQHHRYEAGQTWCGQTYATLAEAAVPLLIDHDQITMREIDEVMTANPTLKLVIVRMNYRRERWLYPLFEKHANLRIETEVYLQYRGIADICARFGADRLIFGSGMPAYSAGGAMSLVLYAEVSDAQKQQIASGNLLDILWGGAAS